MLPGELRPHFLSAEDGGLRLTDAASFLVHDREVVVGLRQGRPVRGLGWMFLNELLSDRPDLEEFQFVSTSASQDERGGRQQGALSLRRAQDTHGARSEARKGLTT